MVTTVTMVTSTQDRCTKEESECKYKHSSPAMCGIGNDKVTSTFRTNKLEDFRHLYLTKTILQTTWGEVVAREGEEGYVKGGREGAQGWGAGPGMGAPGGVPMMPGMMGGGMGPMGGGMMPGGGMGGDEVMGLRRECSMLRMEVGGGGEDDRAGSGEDHADLGGGAEEEERGPAGHKQVPAGGERLH